MKSKTRKSIDEAQAYVNTMDVERFMVVFFLKNQIITDLQEGDNLKGFIPDWIGEFYAYYQWYYNIPSSEVFRKFRWIF